MSNVAALNADEIRDLYRELILDHAKHPRHFGRLDDATHSAAGINPLCGDRLELFLRIDEAGVIHDIAFDGSGCAISVASASLLGEAVTGLDSDTALEECSRVSRALSEGANDGEDLGKLTALLGVREFPVRVKCATLAWHALRSAISGQEKQVTTE